MYQVTYSGAFAGGELSMPASKSAAIRALLCAGLSAGVSRLSSMEPSQDIEAAMRAVAQGLGAEVSHKEADRTVTIKGARQFPQGGCIDCGESGALLRFIIPIAAALGGKWRFTGRGRLPERPIGVYAQLLPAHGVDFRTQGGLPLEIEGRLAPGRYELPGNVSSQFVTGLMLALPLLEGDSEIVLTSALESRSYVDMTLHMLADFGVRLLPTEAGWHVPGGQKYKSRDYAVEGDWSHAAFFLNLAALSPEGSPVRIAGLDPDSLQGDKACVEVFGGFGLDISWEKGVLVAQNKHPGEPFGGLRGQTVDVSQITDMAPAASVCAALSRGETRFTNAARLRLKESDRIAAMEEAVNALGGHARSTEEELIIEGVERLAGGTAQGCNDHRVVMALAGAALRSAGPVSVTDAWSINKTYPAFYRDLEKLGGGVHVVQLG